MRQPLADTHAHLADPLLRDQLDAIVDAAAAVGVERILAVGTDVASSQACILIADRFPQVYAAVGIHPQQAEEFDPVSLTEIRQLAAARKVVAIGEIGLDFYRSGSTAEQQRRAFVGQLELAAELGLPVAIHNRAADEEILRTVAEITRPPSLQGRAGVLHCFVGNAEVASRAWQLGFSLSFAGNLTFKKSEAIRATAAALPLAWLLLETDSPYLAPVPRRGRTNVPANVAYVAEGLAQVRGVPFDTVAQQTTANAAALFHWG